MRWPRARWSAHGATGLQLAGPATDERDFPDPFVHREGSSYYAYATQAGAINVQVMVSPDLQTWRHLGDGLPTLAPWAAPGHTWSPSVLSRGERFVLYYAVREPRTGRQCLSAAVAERPQGPFRDASTGPLVLQLERGGSIDPSPFVDGDGRAYLLWKSDDNARGRPSSLWVASLRPDGLGLAEAPIEVLRHDRAWEQPLIEAPALIRHEDRYYLFYSAQRWESAHYALGYAVGPGPKGPFRKITRARPWMVSGDEASGPGGQEFFTDPDGQLHMCYHAWEPGVVGYESGGARSLHIARVDFSRGRPEVVGI